MVQTARKVVVIGANFIGMKVASSLTSDERHVTEYVRSAGQVHRHAFLLDPAVRQKLALCRARRTVRPHTYHGDVSKQELLAFYV